MVPETAGFCLLEVIPLCWQMRVTFRFIPVPWFLWCLGPQRYLYQLEPTCTVYIPFISEFHPVVLFFLALTISCLRMLLSIYAEAVVWLQGCWIASHMLVYWPFLMELEAFFDMIGVRNIKHCHPAGISSVTESCRSESI